MLPKKPAAYTNSASRSSLLTPALKHASRHCHRTRRAWRGGGEACQGEGARAWRPRAALGPYGGERGRRVEQAEEEDKDERRLGRRLHERGQRAHPRRLAHVVRVQALLGRQQRERLLDEGGSRRRAGRAASACGRRAWARCGRRRTRHCSGWTGVASGMTCCFKSRPASAMAATAGAVLPKRTGGRNGAGSTDRAAKPSGGGRRPAAAARRGVAAATAQRAVRRVAAAAARPAAPRVHMGRPPRDRPPGPHWVTCAQRGGWRRGRGSVSVLRAAHVRRLVCPSPGTLSLHLALTGPSLVTVSHRHRRVASSGGRAGVPCRPLRGRWTHRAHRPAGTGRQQVGRQAGRQQAGRQRQAGRQAEVRAVGRCCPMTSLASSLAVRRTHAPARAAVLWYARPLALGRGMRRPNPARGGGGRGDADGARARATLGSPCSDEQRRRDLPLPHRRHGRDGPNVRRRRRAPGWSRGGVGEVVCTPRAR